MGRVWGWHGYRVSVGVAWVEGGGVIGRGLSARFTASRRALKGARRAL